MDRKIQKLLVDIYNLLDHKTCGNGCEYCQMMKRIDEALKG